MNISEIEKNVQSIVNNFSQDSFIYELLEAYGKPKSSITRLRKGTYNLSKNSDEIIWKKNLLYKVTPHKDLHLTIDQLRHDDDVMKHTPRFLIVTDYKTFLAVDTRTNDTLDIKFNELYKHVDFFLPWAGLEKAQDKPEHPADIKAAEKIARLYDIICEDNPDMVSERSSMHDLNVFLARLLFCYFAEDTEIFEKDLFSNSIEAHTNQDGDNLHIYLDTLFEVLNTEQAKADLQNPDTILDPLNKNKRASLPEYLNKFPYVNGGLFKDKIKIPKFTSRSRKILIECGNELDWSNINPDIFGSMMQAVIHKDERGSMGMHYTSVTNIMKVIEPLFLNDLYDEFEKSKESTKSLKKLLSRLYKIKIFDPACGSGNFLIIAYKELRKLEMIIMRRIKEISPEMQIPMLSNILVSQFYGIELDDFAHEISIVSLWLVQHQMNLESKKVLGIANPSLPLKDSGKIICGNAIRLDWNEVCPKKNEDEVFLLGNPPYIGARNQSDNHKNDINFVAANIRARNNLDYISCWFLIGKRYIKNSTSKCAFVATNSLTQGAHVDFLWPHVISENIEIDFAHTSFKWTNLAKKNAGVSCIIVGLRNKSNKIKYIFENGIRRQATNINAYLVDAPDLYIPSRKKPLSNIPPMCFGDMPNDGGNLLLTEDEYNDIVQNNSAIDRFLRPTYGGDEFINGIRRFSIWIKDDEEDEALSHTFISERIKKVKAYRCKSKRAATRKLARFSYRFGEIRHQETNLLIVPATSSERREYIPVGYLDSGTIVTNSAHVIYKAEPWVFGVISSLMHMVWVKAVAGKLETRLRYSALLCYNTFPIPDLTEKQKAVITIHVLNILSERENYSEKALAELYDPNKMPDELRKAHHDLDLTVERCYRSKPFESDEERLAYLFNLYKEMTKKGESNCLI